MKSLKDTNIDIVYIVGGSEQNLDLLYSLRSIDKFAPACKKIWVSGVKPSFVNNTIGHIVIPQLAHVSKYLNVRHNLMGLCRVDEVSENFILMNDDFILTRPIKDFASINKVLNTFDEQILIYKQNSNDTDYTQAFITHRDLFMNLGISSFNYEGHYPMVINRKKFLELFLIPEIQRFMAKNNVLLYRSIYGNYYKVPFDSIEPDVKVREDADCFNTDWISLSDNMIDNINYPKINNYLKGLFSHKSRFEMP